MKKFNLVAILLFVSLFFSCSLGSQKSTKGRFSFQLDKAVITEFSDLVKQSNSSIKTVARNADGEVVPKVEDAKISEDSDFYKALNKAGLKLVVTDSEGTEIASIYQEWEEDLESKVYTFEDLSIYQTFRIDTYFEILGTSEYYATVTDIVPVAGETLAVPVVLKKNDIISSPAIAVTSAYDKEQTKTSTATFAVYSQPVSFVSDEAAQTGVKDLLQLGYISEYPATVTISFGIDCAAQVFDAEGNAIEAEIKTSETDKSIDFVLTEDFSTNYVMVTAVDAETGLFASTYAVVANDYVPVVPLKVPVKYMLYSKMDPKGIWLVDEIPAADDNYCQNNAPLAGSNFGNMTSNMSFDEENGLWYVGQNNAVYRNGVDIGLNALKPTFRAERISYDRTGLYLYVLGQEADGSWLIAKIDVKGKDAADFKITEENIAGVSEKNLLEVCGTQSLSQFCVDDGKVFLSNTGIEVFYLKDFKSEELTSKLPLSKVGIQTNGLWISDLLVQNKVLYVAASQCFIEGRQYVYQRGGIVSLVYENDKLTLNNDFADNGVYGWTNKEDKVDVEGINHGSRHAGQVYGPCDPDSKKLFGQSAFVGIEDGKLIFSDVGGCFYNENGEDGLKYLYAKDVKRIMILNLSDLSVEIKHTSATFDLSPTTDQGMESLYSLFMLYHKQ